MIDQEKQKINQDTMAQIQQEREEEIEAIRSGAQPQGVAKTMPRVMTSGQEDAAARKIDAEMKEGKMPPPLLALPLKKEVQNKR